MRHSKDRSFADLWAKGPASITAAYPPRFMAAPSIFKQHLAWDPQAFRVNTYSKYIALVTESALGLTKYPLPHDISLCSCSTHQFLPPMNPLMVIFLLQKKLI